MKGKIVRCIICIMLLMGCSTKEEITLSFKDIPIIEYGSDINTQDMVDKTNGDISEYPVIDTKSIGKQKIVFEVSLDGQKKSFEYEVEIRDTQKPIIELKKENIEIKYKETIDIIDNIQSVKDPVDGDLSYKKLEDINEADTCYYTYESNLNTSKAGKYSIKVKAVDKNKNVTESSFVVVVKEEEKQVSSKKTTDSVQPSSENKQETTSTPQQKNYSYVLTSTVEKMDAVKNANKLVTVSSTKASNRSAVVQYFVKSNGKWVEKMKVNGLVGKAGMGVGSEYSTKTPIGTYHFTQAFGIKANPGSLMSYTRINSHHYWCGDQYYNRFVDDTTTDHSACSINKDEHLIDYPGNYDYVAAFNYNSSCTPGKGSAFFLHCLRGNYTMGCIAVPDSQMIYLLKNIDTSTVLVIDLVQNIENH